MPIAYRSYVIRVRRPPDDADAICLDLEDLIEGGRVALRGDEARSLADQLRALVLGDPDASVRTASSPSGTRSTRRAR
jgi:hypothetical protein